MTIPIYGFFGENMRPPTGIQYHKINSFAPASERLTEGQAKGHLFSMP
jgi:hypothetical protein